jgi:RTX calcium-binding nonapeptide repeat (4 copies)
MRYPLPLRALIILAALVAASLVSAGGASAAGSWTGAAEGTSFATQSAAADAGSCDPCVFVYLIRTGNGRVTSDVLTDNAVPINCGVQCDGAFYSWDLPYVDLTPTPQGGDVFQGWTDCPNQVGNRCRIYFDGVVYCIKANFTGSGSGGSCPPPAPPPGPGTGPQTPPPPTNSGLPGSGTRCRVVGTPGPDTLTGTPADNAICGGGGNDVIYGGGGDDFLNGGPGNDRLFGQGGRDRLIGGAGNDVLSGGGGNDALHGGGGRDRLVGAAGADLLDGGSGVDTFAGGGGNDTLRSRDRVKETVNGGSGRDRARADKADRLKLVERRF